MSMLEAGIGDYLRACDEAIDYINVANVSQEAATLERLCNDLWRPLETSLRPLALMARRDSALLIRQMIAWMRRGCDRIAKGRGAAFLMPLAPASNLAPSTGGTLRSEREPHLSFGEMKRVSKS